jgi:hypothetical protein
LFQKAPEVLPFDVPILQHRESSTSDNSAGKSTLDNSDEEELETLVKCTITCLMVAPFQQALFVHDLLAEEPPFQSLEFSFYRTCNECGKTCYFYQSKCSGCNACQH